MLDFKEVRLIDLGEWSQMVEDTYDRIYDFQQQEGCMSRGIRKFKVPDSPSDYENDTVPEVVNGDIMGVSFKAWLERDPEQKIPDDKYGHGTQLFWARNFYPDLSMIVNDLHNRGILEAGNYAIEIDW